MALQNWNNTSQGRSKPRNNGNKPSTKPPSMVDRDTYKGFTGRERRDYNDAFPKLPGDNGQRFSVPSAPAPSASGFNPDGSYVGKKVSKDVYESWSHRKQDAYRQEHGRRFANTQGTTAPDPGAPPTPDPGPGTTGSDAPPSNAPQNLPFSAEYEGARSRLRTDAQNTMAYLESERARLISQYGFTADAGDPGARGSWASLAARWGISPLAIANDPYSTANILQKAYEVEQKSTSQGYAQRGLRHSSAWAKTDSYVSDKNTENVALAKRAMDDALAEITGQGLNAETNYNRGVNDSYFNQAAAAPTNNREDAGGDGNGGDNERSRNARGKDDKKDKKKHKNDKHDKKGH